MNGETMSLRQAVAAGSIFIFGSSAVMGASPVAKQDSWISLLLSILFAVPVFLMYARIVQLFPGKNLFDMLDILFGNIGGRLISLLFIFYSLHLCALVFKNFAEFIAICVMPETPELVILVSMMLVVCYMARCGMGAMGKWSVFMLPLITVMMLFTFLFAVNKIEFNRLLPFMSHDLKTISAGAYKLLTFPLGELVIYLGFASHIRRGTSPYKFFLYVLLIGGSLLMVVMLRNLLILGAAVVEAEYFPSYTAAKVINIADLIARLEATISMNFIIGGIVKSALCLFSATTGIAHLLNVRSYKQFLLPVGLLAVALCTTLYKGIVEMMEFLDIYQFYAVPFQFAIPLLIWLTAEIKIFRGSLPPPQKAPVGTSAEG